MQECLAQCVCVCLSVDSGKQNRITLFSILFKCLMGFFGCHQVAVSEARATIILAETNDAEEVAKVQTQLASVATESKFRVVISLHVGFVLHMVLMCAWNSNGTWLYDMSSLRGAIFLPAVVHT